MISSFSTRSLTAPLRRLRWIFAVGFAVLGDWLFYGHCLGMSLALFLVALAAVVPVTNAVRLRGRELVAAGALLTVGILPLMESSGLLSVVFAAVGLALFAVVLTGSLAQGWAQTLSAARRLLLAGPLRLAFDLTAEFRQRIGGPVGIPVQFLLGWAVPVSLAGVFAALFASANPLIDGWLDAISWSALLAEVSVGRLLLWLALMAATWPFLAIRLPRNAVRPDPRPGGPNPEDSVRPVVGQAFDAATIRRCLVMFNLLFAVQSILDALYLWGGIALPRGMTYAAYAHRGAYPLIVTALLAAAFVLITMGPGGPGERSATIRGLVYLWIAQTVLLVVSAILRLDLYVATYSLTLVRTAAFVWMGLVAVGLILIVARIALRCSNAWLIGANGLTLATVLYACAFCNFGAFISVYNLAHSREITGTGGPFDVQYAMSFGPQAIPAIDRYLAGPTGPLDRRVASWRSSSAAQHAAAMTAWRAWTFRDWRLQRYLAQHQATPVDAPPVFNEPGIR
ncbi:DUF4153 domain-containing protein [Methylobacterium planeticum]|uniref:DUF4173 domain-containing protein n=1 Tax=Methylobacterium planeticum TaxID=2615211 RepID=A0A6N6MM45_9HYPH|nr:DUF4173 domain-containing protein [Methylobacterium planeticum]KAB1072348.1 DUF4173 domain-containing protein [Methylobacterium planeticum]